MLTYKEFRKALGPELNELLCPQIKRSLWGQQKNIEGRINLWRYLRSHGYTITTVLDLRTMRKRYAVTKNNQRLYLLEKPIYLD